MKALTLRQPWAGSIFHGKDVENRSGMFSHRGLLAIHAGQYLAELDAFRAVEDLGVSVPVIGAPLSGTEWQMGAVIGVVDLTNAHRWADCRGDCSPWAQSLKAHHMLGTPRLLGRPVTVPGKQGLWDLPAVVEAEVRRQLP